MDVDVSSLPVCSEVRQRSRRCKVNLVEDQEEVVKVLKSQFVIAWVGSRAPNKEHRLGQHDSEQLGGRVNDFLADKQIPILPPWADCTSKTCGLVLVKFKEGGTTSNLVRRTAEERILAGMHGGFQHCFSFDVVEKCGITRCVSNDAIWTAMGENKNLSMHDAIALGEMCVDRFLSLDSTGASTVGVEFERWCHQYNLHRQPKPITLVFLPCPVSLLLTQTDGWQTMALSWNQKFHKRCPYASFRDDLQQWRVCLQQLLPDELSLPGQPIETPKLVAGQSLFLELQDHIQSLTHQAMLACSDDEAKKNLEDMSKHWLSWLERLAKAHSADEFLEYSWSRSCTRGGFWQPIVAQHGKYSAAFIVQCLQVTLGALLSTNVQGRDYFRSHMRKVICCLPPNLASLLAEQLDHVALPSRQTMDRGRLWLDVAEMLRQRDLSKDGIERGDVYFVLGDSSPIGHRNFLMLEENILDGRKIQLAGQAALNMKHLSKRMLDLPPVDQGEAVDVSKLHARQITESFRHHVNPPTVLAQQRSKLEHKWYNMMHTWRLENWDWPLVARKAKSVFQTCTDGGPETHF